VRYRVGDIVGELDIGRRDLIKRGLRPGTSAARGWPAPRVLALCFQHDACIIACMVALQIRDVPERLRDRLSAVARRRGQSLQAYLFDVISEEARRQDNLAVLDRFAKGRYGTQLEPADVTNALRAARAERDAELGVVEEPSE
jgi:hypothetical protein